MRRLARRCRACFWAVIILVYLPIKLAWSAFLYFSIPNGPRPEIIQPTGRRED